MSTSVHNWCFVLSSYFCRYALLSFPITYPLFQHKTKYNQDQWFKIEKRIQFVLQFETTELSYFTKTNDKIPLLSQSSVVYKFLCLVCSSCFSVNATTSIIYNDKFVQ